MGEMLLPTTATDAEDAPTIGCRSARSARVEVITRAERRRIWTPEQKRKIVLESLGRELTPTEVARKHAISSGQLYTWRQEILGRPLGQLSRSAPSFAQVEMAPALNPQDALAPRPVELPTVPASTAPPRPEGLIEIVLPGGVTLRVDAQVDSRALRRVLGVLEGR